MLRLLLGWIFTANGAKAGATTVGAGGLLMIISFLHTDLKGEIASSEARTRQFVSQEIDIGDLRFQSIDKDISYIKRSIDKQSQILERIDDRVYELKFKTQ